MKAELFSSDFIISILVFFSALAIIAFYYQNLQSDVYENNIRNEMYYKAMNIASLLATSSGYPQYWDSSNVEVLGFYDNGKFNLTKFEEFKEIDEQEAKKMLGAGAYNFFISLKNTTGQIIERPGVIYSHGLPIINAEQVVKVKRLGLVNLEGKPTKVTLEVVLWI
ncbi:MAG: hypothetical protein QXD43_01155 [Candidatus Aenigmatarchaeota archaeon]